uniref:Secreted protein n=1 Tax=Romanomermis culicivorax TaxID=13658 RepID=A0A915JTU8_ROMCU
MPVPFAQAVGMVACFFAAKNFVACKCGSVAALKMAYLCAVPENLDMENRNDSDTVCIGNRDVTVHCNKPCLRYRVRNSYVERQEFI